MNKKFLSLMTAVLMLMAAFASCDKDKNDSGGGSSDNPFVGTWIADDDDGETLEITGSQWMVKYENTTILKGSYTYKGNSANLKVTSVKEDSGIELEEGDEGTAKISGNELIVTFYDEEMVFTKKGGGGGGDDDAFVIEAQNVIGGNSNIVTVAGMIFNEENELTLASVPYKNNGFKLGFPATVADKYLTNHDLGKDARVAYLWLLATDSDKNELGEFFYEDQADDYYASLDYMYADRDVTLKGTTSLTYEGQEYKTNWNCTLKKGWNIMYYYSDSDYEGSYTSTKPSGVSFKWYFWEYPQISKTPYMTPKHKKDSFEQSFFKNK